jgi:hypothetical protein
VVSCCDRSIAPPRPLRSRGQRGERGESRVHARDRVGVVRRGGARGLVASAEARREAAHALDQHPVARHRAIRAARAERGHVHQHQPRVGARERLVLEPEVREHPVRHVHDEHVDARDEPQQQVARARPRQVERQPALVAVQTVVERGGVPGVAVGIDAGPRRDAGLAHPQPRAPAVRRARGLELDHVGAERAEKAPDEGTGPRARELERANAGERWEHSPRRAGVDTLPGPPVVEPVADARARAGQAFASPRRRGQQEAPALV